MKIKSYDEFLNENLFGAYSFYGQGSLYPIVAKLASEGKDEKLIQTYLISLGIDEERRDRVIAQVFNNVEEIEITEKVNEDELSDIAKSSTSDLKKGIDPSKAKIDKEVSTALDKLKSGEDDDTEKDGESKDKDEDSLKDKVDALQSALKDTEKLEKIKKILSETFEMDFSDEYDSEYISGIFEYHTVLEKLSAEVRDKLKDDDFVFPETRSWPIHDEKRAKTALVWATWPQYADKKVAIVKAVLKKYPHLKDVAAAKK